MSFKRYRFVTVLSSSCDFSREIGHGITQTKTRTKTELSVCQ
jgi:hypothetical protein